ncbi:MAG: ABC transporter ATP-binding protein [Gemmataceae bacterium]|nr:ABC transporter ATP-binding protein [Gemmataceae bacterium]
MVRLLLLAITVVAIRFGLLFLSDYGVTLAVLEALTRLRRAIYHHTLRLGPLAFRTVGAAEAVSVSTRHAEVLHVGLHRWLTVSLREPVKLGLLIALTFLVSFWLAVALMLTAILVWMIGSQVAAYFRAQACAAEGESASQLVLIQESLTLMRLIKVFLMEGFNQRRVEDHLAGYSAGQLLRHRAEALARPLIFALGLLAAMILMLVAGLVIVSGHLSITNTLVLASSVIAMYWPAQAILELRRDLPGIRNSANAVFQFLDRQGGVNQEVEAEMVSALSRSLQFDKVSVRETGTGRKLLSRVSFTIKAGQRIGIVGADDMEKHALVYLLVRFLDPFEGEIKLDGKDLRWVTLDSLRVQIGIILQNSLVFNDSVVNNIGCGDPAYNQQRITEAAKIAHAHQFITKLPKGYETPIGELGHALNSGEQFRIALARAILREPAILVIEEPSSRLEDNVKHMIDDTYQRFLPERTVIFLPHRLSTIRSCDQIIILNEGKLEAAGKHHELVNSSDIYRHLQYMEFNEFSGTVGAGPDGKID